MSYSTLKEDTAIQLEDVSKAYSTYEHPQDRLKQILFPKIRKILGLGEKLYHREFRSLKNVSFSVKKGETLGIIGQNGAGKSTLLQIICGTLSSSSGEVQTYGRVAALLELGSGFNPEFTGRENIYLNATILGLSKEEIDAKFNAIADFADIGDFIEQPVKTYSSGMILRVAFAVIAHVEADILIIDEALAVGDAFFVQRCMRFLRKFMETGTVLFVSHDTGAVVNLCDRAILLENGQIISSGDPKDVTKKYLSMEYERTDTNAPTKAIETSVVNSPSTATIVDMRERFINASSLRNDIEIFKFSGDSEHFGIGSATIESVKITNSAGEPYAWLVGGNDIILEIKCRVHEDIVRPIVGFELKDRLGQIVFADNTYLPYEHSPVPANKGQEITAQFAFKMPILPTGDYSFSAAVADGTQESHIQLQWQHDSLIVKVHASSICFGIVGIPMQNISLSVS